MACVFVFTEVLISAEERTVTKWTSKPGLKGLRYISLTTKLAEPLASNDVSGTPLCAFEQGT